MRVMRFGAPWSMALVLVASVGGSLTSARSAEPEAVRVHGTLQAAHDPAALALELADGTVMIGRRAPDMGVTGVKRASLADIHQGSYVGTAALPGPGGSLRALEVHIFPESMRGAGEGHRQMDSGPDKTMTNGAVGVVGSTGPLALTITYKGGEQRVTVDPATPVVALQPGDASLLAPGSAVIASGHRDVDSVVFDRVLVGLDGLDPPM